MVKTNILDKKLQVLIDQNECIEEDLINKQSLVNKRKLINQDK